jgi:hypothetical protein
VVFILKLWCFVNRNVARRFIFRGNCFVYKGDTILGRTSRGGVGFLLLLQGAKRATGSNVIVVIFFYDNKNPSGGIDRFDKRLCER